MLEINKTYQRTDLMGWKTIFTIKNEEELKYQQSFERQGFVFEDISDRI